MNNKKRTHEEDTVSGSDQSGEAGPWRKKKQPPCCVTSVASILPGFKFCACLTNHEECKLQKEEGNTSLFCKPCEKLCGGRALPQQLTEQVVIDTRSKYLMEVLLPEEKPFCLPLQFDEQTGAPLDHCLLEADKAAFLQGLRYRPRVVTEEQAEQVLEQSRALFNFKGARRKAWFDDKGTKSRKMWWFYEQKQMDALKEKYGPLVKVWRGKPQQETAWTENQLVPPEIGAPKCPSMLDALFPDDTATMVGEVVSVNFQHEPFAAHCDDPCNGGYGETIATLTLEHKGVVTIFSSLSGATYTFDAEPLSVWGMRDEVMTNRYAHKVDSAYYPHVQDGGGSQRVPFHSLDCKCRKSINWRGILGRDPIVTWTA